MLKNCQTSCQKNGEIVGRSINSTIDESSYADKNNACPELASRTPSECEVKPDWMLLNCQKSCEDYLDTSSD